MSSNNLKLNHSAFTFSLNPNIKTSPSNSSGQTSQAGIKDSTRPQGLRPRQPVADAVAKAYLESYRKENTQQQQQQGHSATNLTPQPAAPHFNPRKYGHPSTNPTFTSSTQTPASDTPPKKGPGQQLPPRSVRAAENVEPKDSVDNDSDSDSESGELAPAFLQKRLGGKKPWEECGTTPWVHRSKPGIGWLPDDGKGFSRN
jgi:hypothetical protein